MPLDLFASIIAGSSALIVAGSTYWFTKQREREAEIRKMKLEDYKAYTVALSGILQGNSTRENQIAFTHSTNKLNLIAAQPVIPAIREFQDEINNNNPHKTEERANKLLSKVFYEIRKDLGVRPKDDLDTFKVRLWDAIPLEESLKLQKSE